MPSLWLSPPPAPRWSPPWSNIDSKFAYNGVTNVQGAYYIPNLIPRNCRLTVEASGFKKHARRHHSAHRRRTQQLLARCGAEPSQKECTHYDIRHRFVGVVTHGRQFMNRGGILNHILGSWDFAGTRTCQPGPPITVTFANSPYEHLPDTSRPHPVPGVDPVFDGWNIGPNRFPTMAEFTPGTLRYRVSKEWRPREQVHFILR
jgi:hypothetical protein